ncbi:Type II secretory pathway component [Idiomarina aminovorans]|uniref:Type II secretory pathway component n=1 Tax=Idiomarina aminovorans TaxID=2914829 RepID=UPI0020065352|nr:Type II secretory pathway component [Idiomarina sp. ATCH4]MCK7458970.1 Type II secretory pathway component [Idiomarina sp. ATCH4]
MRLNALNSIQRQQGSALVVAIFVIVVLGLLVSVLSKLVRTSSDSTVIEVQGNRAFMAAQSGIQRAMLELYPIGGSFTPCSDGLLADYDSLKIAAPIEKCTAKVTCQAYNEPSDPDYDEKIASHYRLESTGTCEAGNTITTRKLAIETRAVE